MADTALRQQHYYGYFFLAALSLLFLCQNFANAVPFTTSMDFAVYSNPNSTLGSNTILDTAHANVSDVLVITRDDGLVLFVDAVTLQPKANALVNRGQHAKAVRNVRVFVYNGQEFAVTISEDYTFVIWRVATASPVVQRNLDGNFLYDVCWSGSAIYIASNSGTAYMINPADGSTITTAWLNEGIFSVGCSGNDVAFGTASGKVTIFYAANMTQRVSFSIAASYPTALYNFPAKQQVFTSSDVDGRVHITSENGADLISFYGASPRTSGLSASLNPNRLWFSGDGKATQYDTQVNQFVSSLDFFSTSAFSGPYVYGITERIRPNMTVFGAMNSVLYVFNATATDASLGYIPYAQRNTGYTLNSHSSSPDLACYNGGAQSSLQG